MKTLILIFSIKMIQNQSDSLPPQYELFQSLKNHHTATMKAQTAEFETIEKRAWMKWVPTLGMSYSFNNSPRPTISYNLSQVYNSINNAEMLKSKIKAIILSSQLSYKNDSISLVIALKRVEILKSGLRTLEAENQVDDQIWEIQKQKYELKEITPINYLEIKREYIARGQRYEKYVQDIEFSEIEVLRLAKS